MDNDQIDAQTPIHLLKAHAFVADHRALLMGQPLFAGIDFRQLQPFLEKCEFRHLQEREVLISPGCPNEYLFVLLSGQLYVHIESLESDKGFTVDEGEFVGEVSIIDNLAPTAYVAASRDSLLLCIHESVLWSAFFQIPGAGRNLLRLMAARLRARNAAIMKSLEQSMRLEQLEKELLIAQDIQSSMLPQRPFLSGYPQIDVDASMKPAKEIGGDFFDVFPLDDERVCLVIGDVAGKGIPAALFMARTISLLRTEMMKTRDLRQTISHVNAMLSLDNPMCMFVTLMICVLEIHSGQMHYVNGGHNRPVFGRPGDGFHYLAQPKGILVGINPQAAYQEAMQPFKPGDMLILYTDGITEAHNPAQEEYSDQRLLAFLNRQENQASSRWVENLRQDVNDFAAGAEQSDDLTLIVLNFQGNR